MSEELKVRVNNHKATEELLLIKGAKLIDETSFVDTYFNQPKGRVHKIVEKNKGAFLNIFQVVNGTFEVVKEEPIENAGEMKKELTSQYGIKRILKGKRKYFTYNEYTIIVNLIDDVGDFLILVGDNPSKNIVENGLEIKNPEYITVSFDELPFRNTT